ncbi:hypothetical protein NDU88_004049 [Pleurodeles waltl]|uniref:Uncharacterized protein n=1 Tax=Pleurodeles waltl TaxID=8319 RepID=A0AAV7V059_PLEWA|nr:hypothetical protein NDU88_004049 [Pleurodeles waltl]
MHFSQTIFCPKTISTPKDSLNPEGNKYVGHVTAQFTFQMDGELPHEEGHDNDAYDNAGQDDVSVLSSLSSPSKYENKKTIETTGEQREERDPRRELMTCEEDEGQEDEG